MRGLWLTSLNAPDLSMRKYEISLAVCSHQLVPLSVVSRCKNFWSWYTFIFTLLLAVMKAMQISGTSWLPFRVAREQSPCPLYRDISIHHLPSRLRMTMRDIQDSLSILPHRRRVRYPDLASQFRDAILWRKLLPLCYVYSIHRHPWILLVLYWEALWFCSFRNKKME